MIFYKDYRYLDTKSIAMDLIGKSLIHKVGDITYSGIIVETEAYLGVKDSASHGFDQKKTDENAPLYSDAGYLYIYKNFTGKHYLNIVTMGKGVPESVLIRSIEPVDGIEEMKKNRNKENLTDLTIGPTNLCQAMCIESILSGKNLSDTALQIVDGPKKIKKFSVETKQRVGVAFAGNSASWELRFCLRNSKYVTP